MDLLTSLLASFGPYGPLVLLAAGYLIPKLVPKLAGHPVIQSLLAKLGQFLQPTPVIPSPALPLAPSARPILDGLRSILDAIKGVVPNHPALATDTSTEAGAIAALRAVTADLAEGHKQYLGEQLAALSSAGK